MTCGCAAPQNAAGHGSISLSGCPRISDQPIDFYRHIHCRGISLWGAHTMVRPKLEFRPNGEWTEFDDCRTFFRYIRRPHYFTHGLAPGCGKGLSAAGI